MKIKLDSGKVKKAFKKALKRLTAMNREEWLTRVAKGLEPVFKKAGFPIKNYRVTCGFPCRKATSSKSRAVGQCHSVSMSKGKVAEVFISPVVEDSLEVAGILTHELIHVAANMIQPGCRHRGAFVKGCKALGMKGKPTQAEPDDDFNKKILKPVIKKLGKYPHRALDVNADDRPKEGCRLLKVECSCGCIVRMTRKWLDEIGPPTCACGEKMEEA